MIGRADVGAPRLVQFPLEFRHPLGTVQLQPLVAFDERVERSPPLDGERDPRPKLGQPDGFADEV